MLKQQSLGEKATFRNFLKAAARAVAGGREGARHGLAKPPLLQRRCRAGVAKRLAPTAELEQKRMGHTALDCVFLQDYLLTAGITTTRATRFHASDWWKSIYIHYSQKKCMLLDRINQ